MIYLIGGVAVVLILLVLIIHLMNVNTEKTKQVEKYKSKNTFIENENNRLNLLVTEFSKNNKRYEKKIIEVTTENSMLANNLNQISRMLDKMAKEGGLNPDMMGSMFGKTSGDDIYTKQKPKYNVDDILLEINQKGISNISKEKMEFLKKNSK